MKVYILEQEWQTECEHESNIIDVYLYKEKAIERLKELYKEDLEWIQEFAHDQPLEDNTLMDDYSNVLFDICWSSNTITTKELIE